MNILYFSTSVIPSQYANSINVMKMSNALSQLNNSVTLVGISGNYSADLYAFYNVPNSFEVKLVKNSKLGVANRIIKLLQEMKGKDLIYTRYTLAAFISSVFFHKKVVYEYHSEVIGKINTIMERKLAKSKFVIHAFITQSLKERYLEKHPNMIEENTLIVPDAAEKVMDTIDYVEKDHYSCGYIGSFQKGKGIEQVLEIAKQLPSVTFHIVGGKTEEINKIKKINTCKNIIWHGFLPQAEAMRILKNQIDIALLPNQADVIVGNGANIGKWTSPMKLFEYMSYGKMIVASDLPVLKEIIRDEHTALLANSENTEEWINAINKLINDKDLAESVRKNALEEFNNNYTWKKRAEKVLDTIEQHLQAESL